MSHFLFDVFFYFVIDIRYLKTLPSCEKVLKIYFLQKILLDFTNNGIIINASCLPNEVTKIPLKLQAASDCQPNAIRVLIILQKAIYISHIFQITNT